MYYFNKVVDMYKYADVVKCKLEELFFNFSPEKIHLLHYNHRI